MDTDLRALPFKELRDKAVQLAAFLDQSTVPFALRQQRLTEYDVILQELYWRETAGVGSSCDDGAGRVGKAKPARRQDRK